MAQNLLKNTVNAYTRRLQLRLRMLLKTYKPVPSLGPTLILWGGSEGESPTQTRKSPHTRRVTMSGLQIKFKTSLDDLMTPISK